MSRLEDSLEPELEAIATRDYVFQNWAKTFSCATKVLFRPNTLQQVIKIVCLAKKHNTPVKVIGSGHSPSDLACTTGCFIKLDAMNKLVHVNHDMQQVTVEAGMSLHNLHQVLLQHGLALSNLGSISDQSVAGVMATASHGTGARFGCLSTMIVNMTLVTADGTVLHCSRDVHPRIFDAARCSLGALGIVTQVTLQTESAFRLEAIQTSAKLADLTRDWIDTIHAAEHLRIWWFPHTAGDCVVWRANRTTTAATPVADTNWLRDRLVGVHLYQAMLNVARFRPAWIPTITRFMFNTIHARPQHIIDDAHKVFNFDCLFPQYVNEWAIPWEHAPAALEQLDRHIQQSDLKVHFPVEIRFVDEDDIWLSPAYGRKTCYIGVIMYRPYGNPVPYKKYWKAYEDIMRSFDGRPHWAKAHGQTQQDLAASYPKFNDFVAVRQELDPDGMFLNDYLLRHIVTPAEHQQQQAML